MAKLALALLLLLAVATASSASALSGGGADRLDLALLAGTGGGRRECRGTVAECLAEEEEGELGSAAAEGHRRALYDSNHISYASLRRDNVPCNRRGASYYNCRPGAQANPYRRGCSRITRCRG